jgi:hypothetical protein
MLCSIWLLYRDQRGTLFQMATDADMKELNQPRIAVDTGTGVVTIEISTDLGPIAFSYSPAAVEKGIAALAADILKRAEAGKRQTEAVERLRLPIEAVVDAANVYVERGRLQFPQDSIEKFSPSSEAYARGTVEQFWDNLSPALILLMDYLAAAVLTTRATDSLRPSRDNLSRAREGTIDLLQNRLGAAIQRLATGPTRQ